MLAICCHLTDYGVVSWRSITAAELSKHIHKLPQAAPISLALPDGRHYGRLTVENVCLVVVDGDHRRGALNHKFLTAGVMPRLFSSASTISPTFRMRAFSTSARCGHLLRDLLTADLAARLV
jgi:hypothetical protein